MATNFSRTYSLYGFSDVKFYIYNDSIDIETTKDLNKLESLPDITSFKLSTNHNELNITMIMNKNNLKRMQELRYVRILIHFNGEYGDEMLKLISGLTYAGYEINSNVDDSILLETFRFTFGSYRDFEVMGQ